MRQRGSYIYRPADVVWFDAEWQAGVDAILIAEAMRRRGYEDFTVNRCRWLARYRGLTRPELTTDTPRKGGKITVEGVASRQLLRGKVIPEDNRKAAVVQSFPVPAGGYRLCT